MMATMNERRRFNATRNWERNRIDMAKNHALESNGGFYAFCNLGYRPELLYFCMEFDVPFYIYKNSRHGYCIMSVPTINSSFDFDDTMKFEGVTIENGIGYADSKESAINAVVEICYK